MSPNGLASSRPRCRRLLGCRVDAGTARKYDDGDADSATAKVKSVKAFVNELIAGEAREDDLSLPSFREPTRPRIRRRQPRGVYA